MYMISITKPRFKSTFFTIFFYRLRFYHDTILESLLKFKQILIIVIALLAPNITQLAHQLSALFITSLEPDKLHNGYQRVTTLSCTLLTYISWVAWQKNAIRGGILMSYLKSFPLSSLELFVIDYLTIISANGLLLTPLIMLWFYPHPNNLAFILNCILLFIFITGLQWLAVYSDFVKQNFGLKLSSPVFINCLILMRNYLADTLLKLLFCLLTIIGGYIIATKTSFRPYSTIIVAFAILNYITSAWYYILNKEHQQYRFYLLHFPYVQRNLLVMNIVTTLTPLLIFQIALLTLLLIQNYFKLASMLQVMIMQLPLWLILYTIQLKRKRHGHLFILLILVFWVFITINLF